MPTPLPLTVYGPITPASLAVRVTGVLAQADVKIFEDGAPIGQGTAPANGEMWVPLARKPTPGRSINATQKTTGGESEPEMILGRSYQLDGDLAERLTGIEGLANVQLSTQRAPNLRLVA